MFRRTRKLDDFSVEVEEHLKLETERLQEQGLSYEEALAAAHRAFGNVTKAQERFYESGRWMWWDHLWQDVRFALRMLRKSPGFTTVAVLTLALGIGANTTIFSMVDWLVLRVPPVSHARQVVTLATEDTHGTYSNGFSYPNFQDIRNQGSSVFTDVAATDDFHMDGLSVAGNDESIWTSYVTSNFFSLLGIKPAIGSLIRPNQTRLAAGDPVLVLDYAYWQAHFAGDPGVIGKTAYINGHPVTIIGVTAKGFHGTTSLLETQGYLPIGVAPITSALKKDFSSDRNSGDMTIIARLKPGTNSTSAQPALNLIAHRLSAQYPTVDKWKSLIAYRLGPMSPVSDPTAPEMMLLTSTLFLVLAGLVLLLACLNVANLLLARASARQHEMGIRAAVGGGRGRLVGQLLTESVFLAFLGCAAGIILGLISSRSMGQINLKTAIPIVLDFRFDWNVFAYAVAAASITGIVVGIAPAIRATRGKLTELLHQSGRTTTGSHQRARGALVIAQIGGSLMLLIVAGLFVRSLKGVQHSDLGFNPRQVLNFTVDARENGYAEDRGRTFLENLLPRVRALPGVEAASLSATVPMGYYSYGRLLNIPGYDSSARREPASAGYNAVSPEYFKTMGIPILRGRVFVDADGEKAQRVAVINEAMAEKYWHGKDPIGLRFTTTDQPKDPIEIVGEVGNSRTGQLYGPYDPYMYMPLAQAYQMPVTLQVRTALPLATMSGEVVGTIHSLAPALPVFDIQTMTEAVDSLNGLLMFQLGAGLAGALGLLGLALAVIGVYGVVSYGASQRTHEIGIRMALGAKPMQILRMILGQGIVIIVGGVLLGTAAAAAIAKLVGDFLVGVSPFDALTYGSAILVLAAIALAACYIPARRAMGVDPVVALRHE
jgi:predicted permease